MSMILVLDSASDECAVATCEPGSEPEVRSQATHLDHSRLLTAMIDALVDGRRRQIAAVAVTMGPGRYAGLRVGIATAFGIARALDVPLLGTSTLALAAAASGRDDVLAIHPGGRGAFAAQSFTAGHPIGDIELIDAIPSNDVFVCGEGAGALGGDEIGAAQRVAALARMAASGSARLKAVTSLEPIYVRPPMITQPRRSTLSRAAQSPQDKE